MARFRSALRSSSGFVAAVLAAPFTVGLSLSVAAWPRIDVPNALDFAFVFALFGSPVSLLLALFLGVPTIVFARLLLIGSAWYYAACGLAIGAVAEEVSFLEMRGDEPIFMLAASLIGGLVSALTYWLIAERPRYKETALSRQAP